MDILVAQAITIVVFFFTMLGSCLIPLKLVSGGRDYSLGISLANCLSAGVFVATFFIGLLPQVRLQFQVLLYHRQIYTRFPVTEFVVFWGFFIAIFADQLVATIRQRIESKREREKEKNGEELELKNSVTHLSSGCHGDEDEASGHHGNNAECEQNHFSEIHYSGNQELNFNTADFHSSKDCHDISTKSSSCYDDLNAHRHGVQKFKEPELQREPSDSENESRYAASAFHSDSASGYHDNEDHQSHHHHHHHHDLSSAIRPEAGIRVGILLLSLGVHSLFEGMTLGLQTRLIDLFNLFVGVLIHECLVAFAIGVSIANTKLKLSTCIKLAVLISSTIPVGQIIGICIGGNNQSVTNATVSAVLQAVAAGTFIHVTFMEIIPEGLMEDQCKLLKIFVLCLGFGILAVIPIFVNVHDHKTDNKQGDYLYWLSLKDNFNSTQNGLP